MDTRKRVRSEAVASGGVKKSKQALLVVRLVRAATSFTISLVATIPLPRLRILSPLQLQEMLRRNHPCQTAPLYLLNPDSAANITLLKAVNLVTNAILLMANGNLGSLLLSPIWILVPLDPSQAVLVAEPNIPYLLALQQLVLVPRPLQKSVLMLPLLEL